MAQKILNFMQFFGKFGKNICWRPPEGWRPGQGRAIACDDMIVMSDID